MEIYRRLSESVLDTRFLLGTWYSKRTAWFLLWILCYFGKRKILNEQGSKSMGGFHFDLNCNLNWNAKLMWKNFFMNYNFPKLAWWENYWLGLNWQFAALPCHTMPWSCRWNRSSCIWISLHLLQCLWRYAEQIICSWHMPTSHLFAR